MVFYAVAKGRTSGIFLTWPDCNEQVKGFPNAIFKKFDTKELAEDFIQSNGTYGRSSSENVEKTITSFYSTGPECKEEFIPDYYVYTDGSCINNGKENAVGGIGIFFGLDDERNVSQRLEGKQTNNTAELMAIITTYFIIENDILQGKKIMVVSDSEYAINCASNYRSKENISNKELVKQIYDLYKGRTNVRFIHIDAHTGKTDIHSIGNDNADRLANMAVGVVENNKIYLVVPFTKKDEIKKLGGLWDSNKKKWFIYDNNIDKEQILLQYKSI